MRLAGNVAGLFLSKLGKRGIYMEHEVFKRYEKKYMVKPGQYSSLMSCLTRWMIPDQYGRYSICNVYFDAPDYRMIRSSLGKPVYKEKLRLRGYGAPGEEDLVFLELKKKYDGVVYKRRTAMSLKAAKGYLYYGVRPDMDSQILREIDYMYQFYQIGPKAYLSYDRIAFSGK